MTMTLDIPSELHEQASAIPDLSFRVAEFLRHEVKMEALRQERHSTATRDLVRRAVQQAHQDQTEGFDWETSFETLKQQHETITDRL